MDVETETHRDPSDLVDIETETSRDLQKVVETETLSRVSLFTGRLQWRPVSRVGQTDKQTGGGTNGHTNRRDKWTHEHGGTN